MKPDDKHCRRQARLERKRRMQGRQRHAPKTIMNSQVPQKPKIKNEQDK